MRQIFVNVVGIDCNENGGNSQHAALKMNLSMMIKYLYSSKFRNCGIKFALCCSNSGLFYLYFGDFDCQQTKF